jgi:hypothetical protein
MRFFEGYGLQAVKGTALWAVKGTGFSPYVND